MGFFRSFVIGITQILFICVISAQTASGVNMTEKMMDSCYDEIHTDNLTVVEWVPVDSTLELQTNSTVVHWSFNFTGDKQDPRGFRVRYLSNDIPPVCKLILLDLSTVLHGEVQFRASFTKGEYPEAQVKPLVWRNTIEDVQWNALSFLNIKDHDITVLVGGPIEIKSLTFYLYRKGDEEAIFHSLAEQGSPIVVQNLTNGTYYYQLEDIVLDQGQCPCYLKAVGQILCQPCERKASDEFCIPKCSAGNVVTEGPVLHEDKSNLSQISIIVPSLVLVFTVLVAIVCFLYRWRTFGHSRRKYYVNSRLLVLHQSGTGLHDKVIRRFCTVLRNIWDVDVIEDDGVKSNALLKYDRGDIYKILILSGGHGTRGLSQRYFISSTDCGAFPFLPKHWLCRPIIVSYLESVTELDKHFPLDIEKYDLSSQTHDLLDHLNGCELRSSFLSKLTYDIKRLHSVINVAKSNNLRSNKQFEFKKQDSFKSFYSVFDERHSNHNFFPLSDDSSFSLYHDIIGGINQNLDRSVNGQHESVSIGGKSV